MSKLRCYVILCIVLLVGGCSQNEQTQSRTESSDSELDQLETTDPAFTSKLEQSLLHSTMNVSEAQNETHDAIINSDFEDRSEQHRVDFIDAVLAESSIESEQDAESMADRFEELKSIEHAPATSESD